MLEAKGEITLIITVNETKYKINVPPALTLLEILREKLFLSGVKSGCEKGKCGACTVIVNGKAVNSCLVIASQINGADIQTIEGLQRRKLLHPLQEAFISEGAVQCGFCTPGMIMSAKALLDKNKMPQEEEIKKALEGNLCRCTGYSKIILAVKKAAKKMIETKAK